MTFRVSAEASRSVPGVRGQFRLPPAVVFQPAQVVGQLPDGGAVLGGFHELSFKLRVRRFKFTGSHGEESGNEGVMTGTPTCRPLRLAVHREGLQRHARRPPVNSSMIAWAVPRDSCTPARKWPVATKRLSRPGTGPMNGSPSGVAGPQAAPALHHRPASVRDGPSRRPGGPRLPRRCSPSRSLLPVPRSSRRGYGHRAAGRDSACRTSARG